MSKTIVVGGAEFEVGKASAAQVASILKVVKSMADGLGKVFSDQPEIDGFSIAVALLTSLTEDNLITLASASIGSDREFARENFDLVWVSDAIVTVIEENDIAAVIRNFSRLTSLVTA